MNIIDNWEGYYEYGQGYPLPQFGERVKIKVNFQGSNDSFNGTLVEEPSEHSVPLEASIKGFIDNDLVSFVKTYPKIPRFKEYGSTEKYFEDGTLDVDHFGYLDEDHDAMYGTWSITEQEPGGGPNDISIVYGSWLLRRVK